MANEEITRQVLDVLKNNIRDYIENREGDLIEFDNIELQYSTSLDCDGYHEINCHPRIMTQEGLGPIANTWVLSPEFLDLWDALPWITWIRENSGFIQICGTIDDVNITVNLWGEHPEELGTEEETS